MKLTNKRLKRIIKEEIAKVLKEGEDEGYVDYEVQIINRIVKSWTDAGNSARAQVRTLEAVPNYTKISPVDPTILKAAVDGAMAMVAAYKKQASLNNAVIADIKKKYPDSFKKQKR